MILINIKEVPKWTLIGYYIMTNILRRIILCYTFSNKLLAATTVEKQFAQICYEYWQLGIHYIALHGECCIREFVI